MKKHLIEYSYKINKWVCLDCNDKIFYVGTKNSGDDLRLQTLEHQMEMVQQELKRLDYRQRAGPVKFK